MPVAGLRIVSGGQTGVDRAALDAALARGMPCGGWCPRGRLAEDGPLAARYPLAETPLSDYDQRTRWNVRDSDATLILTRGVPLGGTAYTLEAAQELNKPHYVADLTRDSSIAPSLEWLRQAQPAALNVAGPRESTAPGIYAQARRFLDALLDGFAAAPLY